MSETLTTLKAAGTMIITARDGKALFLRRSSLGDHPGEWCFPGGKIEPGETAQDAAERETREEIGPVPYGKIAEWTRQVADGVDFTTFVAHTADEFTPTIDAEHTAWTWAPIAEPPEPLHPGARVALARLTMNELDLARAISIGQLVSPQRYGMFWLFAIRITGTGLAYRSGLKEFCWRDPAIYLTDEFLARCNGLPVIWDHPDKKPKLDSEEYKARNVGSVFVPYLKGDEVWAVCKVYDDDCLEWMMSNPTSTSPAVVFTDALSENQSFKQSDGSTLLIEGVPQLLDHIALCGVGVWDKGGAPSGVDNHILTDEGLTGMLTTEQQAAADQARKDSDAKLDQLLSGMTGITSRLDAIEAGEKERADKARHDAARKDRFGARKDGETFKDYKARHDADELAMTDSLRKDSDDEDGAKKAAKDCRADAEETERKDGGESFEKWAKEENDEPAHRDDKARKDAEDEKARSDAAEMEKKETMKADEAARKDAAVSAENANIKSQLAALQATLAGMTAETPASERDALARAQSRADSVAAMFGDRASAPIPGEKPIDYRKRQLVRFQKHSERFKTSRFDSLDDAMLTPVEDIVYADAVAAAKQPGTSAPGTLVPITTREGGRDVTRFNGDPMAWMSTFMTGGQVGKFNREPNRSN